MLTLVRHKGENGLYSSINVEYFTPEEFKISIVKDGYLMDSFTVVHLNQAMINCMSYQNRLFGTEYITLADVYDKLVELKEGKIA